MTLTDVELSAVLRALQQQHFAAAGKEVPVLGRLSFTYTRGLGLPIQRRSPSKAFKGYLIYGHGLDKFPAFLKAQLRPLGYQMEWDGMRQFQQPHLWGLRAWVGPGPMKGRLSDLMLGVLSEHLKPERMETLIRESRPAVLRGPVEALEF
jgi:hypothetical protein